MNGMAPGGLAVMVRSGAKKLRKAIGKYWWRAKELAWVRSYHFFDAPAHEGSDYETSASFREIDARDAARHNAAVSTIPLPLGRFSADHRCFGLVTAEGALLCWGWLSGSVASGIKVPWEAGLFLALPQGLAYIWDCHTTPEQRQKGHYRSLLKALRHAAKAQGAGRVLIYCNENNIASRRGILGAGFTPLIRCRVAHLGPISAAQDPKGLVFGGPGKTVTLPSIDSLST